MSEKKEKSQLLLSQSSQRKKGRNIMNGSHLTHQEIVSININKNRGGHSDAKRMQLQSILNKSLAEMQSYQDQVLEQSRISKVMLRTRNGKSNILESRSNQNRSSAFSQAQQTRNNKKMTQEQISRIRNLEQSPIQRNLKSTTHFREGSTESMDHYRTQVSSTTQNGMFMRNKLLKNINKEELESSSVVGNGSVQLKKQLSNQYGSFATRNLSVAKSYTKQSNRPQTVVGDSLQIPNINMNRKGISIDKKKSSNQNASEILNLSVDKTTNGKKPISFANFAQQSKYFQSKNGDTNDSIERESLNTSQFKKIEQPLRERNSLSPYTNLTNCQIKEQLVKFDELENSKNFHDRRLNVDCQQLLVKTNREIKSLNYKLMRVITSDDYHTILHPFRLNELEIIEQTYIICKVQVKGYLSPARFNIQIKNDSLNQVSGVQTYKKNQKSYDLKVFMSTYYKEPNEQHHDKVFVNQRKFQYGSTEKSGKFSQTECVYLSFFSLKGCSINIFVSFPSDTAKELKKLMTQTTNNMTSDNMQIQENFEERTFTQTQKRDIKEIEESLMATLKKHQERNGDFSESPSKDYIHKNKSIITHWSYFQDARKSQVQDYTTAKVQSALQKKMSLDLERRKKHLFTLIKWDYIRQKKKEKMLENLELNKKKQVKTDWIMFMRQYWMMKAIYEKFNEKWSERERHKKTVRSVRQITKVMRNFFARIAGTQKQRYRKRIQFSFTFGFQKLDDSVQGRASQVLKLFLTDTSAAFDLKKKFLNFCFRVSHIQLSYKKKMKSMKNRFQFLQEYFEKERQFLIKFFINKKTKKAKTLLKRLNLLNDNVRDKIIKIYFEKCTNDYSVKFNRWRMKHFGENSGVDTQALQARLDLLDRKEELLFQGTNIVEEEGTANASKQSTTKEGGIHNGTGPILINTKKGSKILKTHKTMIETKDGKMIEAPPMFLTMPSREVLHRLVIRATDFKAVKDINF